MEVMWSLLITLFSGIAGVIVGYVLTSRLEKRKRQLAFVQQRLDKLYSPLVALRTEIRTLSSLREVTYGVYSEKWADLIAKWRGHELAEGFQSDSESFSKSHKEAIEYYNAQLKYRLLPAYARMNDVIRQNLWLADERLRSEWPKLIEFIELWHFGLAIQMPLEIAKEVAATEGELEPLYEVMESTMEELRRQMEKG
ncbi:MAG: hypothetical protein AB1725_03330 [Armatimonadota bacterium]